jgi:ABC-2 type transport system ATP-binding protein
MISIKNLSKTFSVSVRAHGPGGVLKSFFKRERRLVQAVRDVSFDIGAGELVGYIGPNGAGKSTTIKVLSGILVPDSGEVRAAGLVPWKDRVRYVRKIGVVFGQRTQLWWDLPVIDSFGLLRDIYRIPLPEYKRNLDELVETIGLADLLAVPVRQLSLGQRMRCDLAASNLHAPEILYLDEPTIGLDAVSKLAVRDFIRKRNESQGTTVILTTHDLDDIEALCRRIMVIGKGEILFDGAFAELNRRLLNEKHLVIDLKDERAKVEPEGTRLVEKTGSRLRLAYDPRVVSTKTLVNGIMEQYDVHDLAVENPPIERLIAKLYEEHDL